MKRAVASTQGTTLRRPEVRDQQLVAVADLLVVERSRHHVGAAVQHARAAVHVQASLGIARRMLDRDQLGAARAVHVGELEADELDPLGAPAVQDFPRVSRHQLVREVTKRPMSFGGLRQSKVEPYDQGRKL